MAAQRMAGNSRSNSTNAFAVLTVGHSNHPIEQFLALISGAGVTALVDVRSVPYSRWCPWFSAKALRGHLEGAGIVYVPMGEALGGRPSEESLYRNGVADYEAMAARPAFQSAIDTLAAMNGQPCLMCSEREPLDCHRCLLAAPALVARGLSVGHILADGSLLSHATIEEQLIETEGTLFAGDADERAARLAAAYRRRAQTAGYRLR